MKTSYAGRKSSKYSYPDFNNAEWALYNRTRITSEGINLDESTKVYYASSKGYTIFAVMSTDDDTLIYGTSGKQAANDYEYAQNWVEGKNETHRDSTTLSRILSDIKSKQNSSAGGISIDGHRRAETKDVPISGRPSGSGVGGDRGESKGNDREKTHFSRGADRARSIDGYRRELEEARRRRRVGRLRLYYYRAKRVKELEDEYAKAIAAEN